VRDSKNPFILIFLLYLTDGASCVCMHQFYLDEWTDSVAMVGAIDQSKLSLD